jgi:hypothetical protein
MVGPDLILALAHPLRHPCLCGDDVGGVGLLDLGARLCALWAGKVDRATGAAPAKRCGEGVCVLHLLASGRMGQRLTRLSLMDQTRISAGGSQTGGDPGALWQGAGAPVGSGPLLAR